MSMSTISKLLTAAVAAITVTAMTAGIRAQPAAPKFLKASPTAPKSVQAGKPFTITVAVTIDSPYHIQGNPSKDGYIATEMEVGPLKGFKIDRVTYPKPMETSVSGERLPVYEGKVGIKAEVTPDKSVKPGKYTLPITLKYQGCDRDKCFPPTTLSSKATVTVTAGAR